MAPLRFGNWIAKVKVHIKETVSLYALITPRWTLASRVSPAQPSLAQTYFPVIVTRLRLFILPCAAIALPNSGTCCIPEPELPLSCHELFIEILWGSLLPLPCSGWFLHSRTYAPQKTINTEEMLGAWLLRSTFRKEHHAAATYPSNS
jgi:hypothetical protein